MLSWLFSDPLGVGTPAPDFTLSDEAGHSVTLSKLRGKTVVLIFYPGDDTPVCTKQLCDFRDHWKEARERGTMVFGLNPQSGGSHTKFRQKFKFPFPLLVDPGQKVASLYHANGLIIKRTVYRIDGEGVIRFAQRGAPAASVVLGE